MYIYSNLKYIREKMNMSQVQFANKLGLASSSVSRWESSVNGITLETAYMIAEKLNIPLADLICTDLSIQDEIVLDKDHILTNVIMAKTKELSEQDKEKIINLIDIYKN